MMGGEEGTGCPAAPLGQPAACCTRRDKARAIHHLHTCTIIVHTWGTSSLAINPSSWFSNARVACAHARTGGGTGIGNDKRF